MLAIHTSRYFASVIHFFGTVVEHVPQRNLGARAQMQVESKSPLVVCKLLLHIVSPALTCVYSPLRCAEAENEERYVARQEQMQADPNIRMAAKCETSGQLDSGSNASSLNIGSQQKKNASSHSFGENTESAAWAEDGLEADEAAGSGNSMNGVESHALFKDKNELTKLRDLLDSGIITAEEYQKNASMIEARGRVSESHVAERWDSNWDVDEGGNTGSQAKPVPKKTRSLARPPSKSRESASAVDLDDDWTW